MAETRRRLAAIVAADVVGYSRLMGADEEGTIAALQISRQKVIDPRLAKYHGRIANTAGDSLLIEFPSAVDALRCTIEIQDEICRRNADVPEEQRLLFRIGINVGDVVSEGDDLLGDGVNVAARLEGMADPGGILISRTARDQVRDRMQVNLEDLEEVKVKNIDRPVRVFRVLVAGDKAIMPKRRLIRFAKYAAAMALVLSLGSGGIWWWYQLTADTDRAAIAAAAVRERPAIAVMPFANLSDDKGQDYFADGITTDLSRVTGLYVASRSATLRFRDNPADTQHIGSELGVGHILEGSIRRAGEQIRVTAKLIDATTGEQIWAERFDRDIKGVFSIQDEIAKRVVSQLSTQFNTNTLTRIERAYTPNIDAYDLYIRGRGTRIPPTPGNLTAALAMFEEAIRVDPKFAGGYAGASFVHILLYADSTTQSTDPGFHLKAALDLARKAVDLDPGFGDAWASLAEAHMRGRQYDEAFQAIEKAIAAAPSDSLIRALYGRFLGYAGRPEEGIEQVKQAMRMSPDSLPMLYFLGANYRAAGMLDLAIEALAEHRRRLGGRILPAPTTQLIAAYVQSGRLSEARAEAKALMAAVPDFTSALVTRTHVYKNPEDMKAFLDALQEAGLP